MNDFLLSIKDILGKDFDKFLQTMDKEPYRAIRINTLKADKKTVLSLLDFVKEQTPFCKDGYYIDFDAENVGNHPLHHCGAYYVQEPSAMSAVTMLNVQKGDKVLDLCAAPGSKSTQIASALSKEGLLWANEIVPKRASILLSNIERMGIRNAVVSCESPENLCPRFENYFDKILVDAPCSGEGMFRKDKNAYDEWSKEHVKACAVRQLNILESAKSTLKAGGEMVYSTCTFSKEENEGVVTEFLKRNKDFELVDSNCDFATNTLKYAKRIFPFQGGEGHFAAKFRKIDGEIFDSIYRYDNYKDDAFLDEIFARDTYKNLYRVKDRLYSLPSVMPDISHLNILRAGVLVAEIKKGRTEPCHNAFSASSIFDCVNVLDLSLDDERLKKFLHGEEIEVEKGLDGYTVVCVNGITLSFGKAKNGRLKNKYPKGLRTL
ncbi:MAG: RsmF rRNA methyltransferase first C-terminal domain-containing protein [Oscillospiraceae bacterium]|nr:RsmF rRNA methyltransferase first C-terminal domain-containing protein [Candidatus Ruminococcus equi]